MRCPKCQYISFDSERCRNCGYELALTPPDPPVDVATGRDEPPPGRLRDVSLTALDAPLSNDKPGGDRDRQAPFGNRRPITAADLPLFTERIADDQAPLVTPPAVPRPPLSVRRANPVIRARPRNPLPEELSLDLAVVPSEEEREQPEPVVPAAVGAAASAGVVRRIGAGLIDTVSLGGIHATVIYLTLRLCGLQPNEWRILPILPLAAFLLLLCGGYFVLFTAAGGQTIGKMAARIRVVNAPDGGEGHPRVSFRTAMIRTGATLLSVLPLGAGFLPVLFSPDRRALHDRLAETRVVPA
jgi:uncharacterized RDD family membrane protein YckC